MEANNEQFTKKIVRICPIKSLTTTVSYISRLQHFCSSLWYFFFILLNINCFLNEQKFTKKSFAISFEVFDNRFEHLYLKARWPRFVILTPPKYRCCVPSKKWINLSFLQIHFLVTKIILEGKKDVICRVPLSEHWGPQYVLRVFQLQPRVRPCTTKGF